ncbi:MAG: acetate/propionate family kinase [Deltaproteobacteria bacterium]|nr:acetate/propionate family kinase [Deltaproteobacteria bacterium]
MISREILFSILKNKVELFNNFSDKKLNIIIDGSRLVTIEENETVIEEGDKGRFLGVVLSGGVKIVRVENDGTHRVIGVFKEYDIFGEIALITNERTVVNVIGSRHSEILLIPQSLFSRLLISEQSAISYLSRLIVQRASEISKFQTETKSNDYRRISLDFEKRKQILVINCGSSSLKYAYYDTYKPDEPFKGIIERIGEREAIHKFTYMGNEQKSINFVPTHKEAFLEMIKVLSSDRFRVFKDPCDIDIVGHRVVHGGDKYNSPTIITDEVEEEIEKASIYAPLHNPINLIGIKESRMLFKNAIQIAVFDTAFHQTMPPYAFLYAFPYEYYSEKKIRRYGFHGTSHLYVSLKAAEFLGKRYSSLSIITCHLGNGCSICAIDHGRSIDTSMGFTPVEGLIMGTRCGDVDPGVLIHIMRTEKIDYNQLDKIINKFSGLRGISGLSNDMREIENAASQSNYRALIAIKSFSYRLRKYIGSYIAAMGGVDVIVFTGGIGQGSSLVRSLSLQGLEFMGIEIDEDLNKRADGFKQICDITAKGSKVKVLIIPTDEEFMIAKGCLDAIKNFEITKEINKITPIPIPIEVSAYHVHLSRDDVEKLFGAGYKLTFDHELSQIGQYACRERVNLIGPKGRIDNVRILGPERNATQVEISMTEEFKLGINAPIRASGDIEGTPGITIEGPKGTVKINKGVILTLKHIHMSFEDALRFGIRDGDLVQVKVEGERGIIFDEVLVRVNKDYRLAMHINTDEANISGIKTGDIGFIKSVIRRD